MSDSENKRPIQHRCSNGTEFKAVADLSTVVQVTMSGPIVRVMADFAEFGAWHAMEIRPTLNGFRGYDCVRYDAEVRQP